MCTGAGMPVATSRGHTRASASGAVVAGTKNPAAHTHHGAARSNRRVHIRGHAQTDGIPALQPRQRRCANVLKHLHHLGMHGLHGRIRRLGVGNTHHPAQLQSGQASNHPGQLQGLLCRAAGLALASIHIHLNADLQRRQIIRALLVQALGNFFAVHGVHPVKVLGDQPGLVALYRANAMPLQGLHIRHGTHGGNLVDTFLDVVFAKRPLPGQRGFAHRLGGKGFGHREQRHLCGLPAALLTCIGNLRVNALELAGNHRHNLSKRTKPYSRCQPFATCKCARPAASRGRTFVDITTLLAFSVKNKASDLHLSAGLPPMIRVHGDVRRINVEPLDHKTVHAMVYDIMTDSQRKAYEENLEVDFSFEISGLARFRVNAFNQYRGSAAVFRTIPSKILTLEDLNAPKIFADLALKPRGLVLVTGPTGSGKSTTLAAMVDYLNNTEHGHILTVEDPIEFVHDSKKCLVNQREVGPMTQSFAAALRSALREDPDCILVGEMRDLETIRLAMTAAETGHLVFGTLHTSSAAKTIDRIIDVFPAEEKEMVRAMLSESLQAVISQTLCKTKDGNGRVAAHEIMLGTSAIRNLIREAKVAQMYSAIQTGSNVGMQTLDQNLTELVRRNVISAAEARGKAKSPDNFPG